MTRLLRSSASFPMACRFPRAISLKNGRHLTTDQKRTNNAKRVERVQKRFHEKLQDIHDNRALHASFQKHRHNIVKLLDSPANIEALFNGKPNDPHIKSYEELTTIMDLTYYDEIQNSIMYFVSLLINSILVELNIRRRFSPHDLPPVTEHSLFLYRDIVKDSKDEDKKVETLKLLSNLYPKEEGVPQSFEQFFKLLDHPSVFQLVNRDLKSDSFNSLEATRLHFMHYMSSQYLNYEHGDYLNSMELNRLVEFKSSEVRNEEIEKLFLQSFTAYKANDFKLHHLRLALEICLTLLQSHTFTPSYRIFTMLMDNFGEAGLYQYQTLALEAMCSYKDKTSLLAEGQLNTKHFIEMVEKEHLSLASLAKYYGARDDETSFQNLLAIFRFEEILQHEWVLERSYISSLVSKSRFIRSKIHITSSMTFETNEAIFVPVEAIYEVIKTCILLQQFQYIDHLVNKLLMHSVSRDDAIYIALRLGDDQTPLLISQTDDSGKLASQVFTKDLFKILIRASRESEDLGRMMWILPHLDHYLEENLQDSNIRALQQEEDSKDMHVDQELVQEIYNALRMFSLEGKLAFYDAMFGIMRICT